MAKIIENLGGGMLEMLRLRKPNREKPCSERRAFPTFLLPAEPPTWGEERDSASYRKRIRDWNLQIVGDLNAFPYIVFVFYCLKVYLYIWLFANKVASPLVSVFAEDNIKRFILYNILGDVVGFNSTGGPLGFRVKFFFVTWYNLLRPGSITFPLIPGVPAKRNIFQSLGYIAYLYTLFAALRTETPLSFAQIAPIVSVLALLTPFDLVTFQASRGEHSGYMLVCLLFPWSGSAVHGLRLCQAFLWSWAGIAKFGPWMKYVNAFMMPNSKLMPLLAAFGVPVKKLLYRDPPNDVNPSRFLSLIAQFAVIFEICLGPVCLFAPAVGVPLATLFHLYILSMTPFASVMEWNCACLFFVHALFNSASTSPYMGLVADPEGFAGYSLTSFMDTLVGIDQRLLGFLVLVLVLVPLVGQLYPKLVPFLIAFRPYAGNWRFTWHIVDNKARNKLRKLRVLEGIFISENAQLLWCGNPHFCDQFEDYFSGNMVFFPHFRPLIPMMEKLQQRQGWKSANDFTTLFNEIFFNGVMGWTLGTGEYAKPNVEEAIASTCGFEEGECFIAVFEPHGLLDHTSEWHLSDITKPSEKLMHGKMPYAELEDMQPTDMTLEMFDDHSVLSGGKKGR